MRPPHRILDRNHVHRLAAQHPRAHLRSRDYKLGTSAQAPWAVLPAAAARITSLPDARGRLRGAPPDEAAREALLATLPDCAELRRRLDAAPAGYLPTALPQAPPAAGRRPDVGPYRGRPSRDPAEAHRGRAKGGTGRSHAYATAYAAKHGRRYTVAPAGVAGGEPLKDVLRRLPRQAARAGVRPRLLSLDRGSYGAAAVRYLQAARHPSPMPAVCRGRPPRRPGGPAGSYVFRARTSGRSTYTPTEGATCRLQFGIESGYRLMHEARVRTSGRRPEVRLLYAGIAPVPWDLRAWPQYAAPAGRPGHPAGAAAAGDAVALAAPCSRRDVRGRRRDRHR